jgi:hypothetical protein
MGVGPWALTRGEKGQPFVLERHEFLDFWVRCWRQLMYFVDENLIHHIIMCSLVYAYGHWVLEMQTLA